MVGFFKKYYLASQTIQFNLETMEKLKLEDCILVDNLHQGSIEYKMEWVFLMVLLINIASRFSDKVTNEQSSAAMREVNQILMEYFYERQLVVFRAAILFSFLSPYLRGK